MRGTLYVVHNIINNKMYVGKTYNNVNKRWNEHIRDRERYKNRPLYRALNKYGLSAFEFVIIGVYEETELELAEINYIQALNSYKDGYNATLGGEGKRTIIVPDRDIIEYYKQFKSLTAVGHHFNIDRTSVKRILDANNITVNSSHGRKVSLGFKRVKIIELDKEFNSQLDCAQYLIDNKIASGSIKSVAGSLNKVCRNQRKSYKGLTFKDL